MKKAARKSSRVPPARAPVPAPQAPALPVPPRLASTLALPLALVATVLVHVPAVRTFFAQDDVTFLSRARGLEPTPWTLARPLSEGVTWRLLHAAFGLHPLPYHLFNFGLHLLNTTLVYWIGRRLTGGPGAACAAAVLFGVSSIAFTPLHWTSCLVELEVTTFALAAFLLYLRARDVRVDPAGTQAPHGTRRLLWISALLGLAATLSKESAILFPLVFFAADRRSGLFAPDRRTLLPGVAAALAYGAAFLITIRTIKYVGSEAYAMTPSPSFLAGNLATYLRWLVVLFDPVRDLRAAMNPFAMPIGATVALGAVLLLLLQLGADRHPEEVGAAWFLTFLLPVIPLRHHTYLYYLYLPWAGAAWMFAGAGQRALKLAPKPLAWAAVLAVGAFAGVEGWSVRARERAMTGSYAADKTMRESRMLRNAIAGLDSMRLSPGTRIGFVNPAPRLHETLGGGGQVVYSYLPFEGTMRGGETMRLFYPALEVLGIGDRVPSEWEDAEIVLFFSDGRVRHVGRGGRALTDLGYRLLGIDEWAIADSMFRRARVLGDTLPDGTFGLIITSDFLGDAEESREFCREFLRRWPRERRAAVVDSALKRSLRGAIWAR